MPELDRRDFLATAAAIAMACTLCRSQAIAGERSEGLPPDKREPGESADVGKETNAMSRVRLFDLQDVRILDGPFKTAQDVDENYMLAHDPDRLLAPYRREAGLPERAKPYGNWESMGLDGHTAGHYLSTLAMMHAATGHAELKRRLDYMVSELAECQKANGNGYVGGVPNSKKLWSDVAAGRFKAGAGDINGAWVPWYNLHKMYAGMRDAYLIAHHEQAKQVLIGMADWCVGLLNHLTDAQVQDMLQCEHGGMNEVLADVFSITADQKYLTAAKRFCDHRLLDPLVAGRDELTGLHANTQIPKVIGFERIASLNGDPAMHRASLFFWNNVTTKRSVSIGGNSVNEHFNPIHNFSSMIEDRTGPETCNTYNMLKLTAALFQADPLGGYAEFYERALFNHILSTEDPTRGGFVYFTPMRPDHYRVYSTAQECFWCCVGTGLENHATHGKFIYAYDDRSLYVNLFIASQLTWAARGLTLRQETRFPDQSQTHLVLSLKAPTTFSLKVRRPAWLASSGLKILVNGQEQSSHVDSSDYVAIRREWHDGDTVAFDLPMKVQTDRLPDGSSYASVRYGPVVLAAETGTADMKGLFAGPGRGDHIARGPLHPIYDAPTFVTEAPDRIADQVVRDPGDTLSFSAKDLIQPVKYQNLKLIPISRVQESRYEIYFPVASAAEYAEQRQRGEGDEKSRLALDAATIDQVTPGAQQSEVDHNFKGQRTNDGNFEDRSWRDARGWFSYDLKIPADKDADLLITLYGGDKGRNFDILADNKKLAELSLGGSEGDRLIQKRFPIPRSAADTIRTIKFVAHPGSIAGGLFDVRVVNRNFNEDKK